MNLEDHRKKWVQEAVDGTPHRCVWTDRYIATDAALTSARRFQNEIRHQEATLKSLANGSLPAIPVAVASLGLLLGIAAQLPTTFQTQHSFGRLSLASAATAGLLLLLDRR